MKKRLLLAFLITLLAVPHLLAATTYDFSAVCESGQTLYYKKNKGNVSVVSGNTKAEGDLIIPATVTNKNIKYDVTEIGYQAFYECRGLTSINIPNSVTSIDYGAFSGCSDMASISVAKDNLKYDSRDNCNAVIETSTNKLIVGCKSTIIPNSVTSIGSSSFSDCSGLTSIDIPNSVTGIGDFAFIRCTGLTSVNISNSVTSIGDFAFDGCTGLTSISVAKDNLKYDSRDNCNAVIETKTNTLVIGCKSTIIPNSVTSIGARAFKGCTGLISIDIPNSVTSIGENAFNECRGLTSVNIPNSVTSIGDGAFNVCTGLTVPIYNDKMFVKLPMSYSGSFSIPNGITEIIAYAFAGCEGLTSVNIPNSVTSIGKYAFRNCTGLTVSIPNSVTSIGAWAFDGSRLNVIVSIFIKWNPEGVISSDNKIIYRDCQLEGTNICSASLKFNTAYLKEFPYTEYGFICDNKYFKSDIQGNVKIDGLQAGKKYEAIPCYMYLGSLKNSYAKINISTQPLNATISVSEAGPSTLSLIGSCYEKEISNEEIIANGITYPSNTAVVTGLKPNNEYLVLYRMITDGCNVEITKTCETESKLTLKTLNPKVSEGKVVVCAETNISDYETNVGFEWRKYDAPASLPSKSGKAFLYNGSMKGTIKNLATDSYWNVRAYYTANDGTSYYGDWVTFDPGDFSWFEPEVHTYPATIVPNQPPQLRGYAVEGSDEVEEQGFEYWPKMPSTRSTEPEGIKRIPATGTVMQATITDYEYSTEYICRSYVKTSTKTFYGEEQTFTTPDDPRPLFTFIVQAGENGRVNEEVNGQYREGESVEITATPNQGYKFTQWSDLMTDNPRTVTVTQDTTIVASFEKADVSTTDILADPDKTGVQVSDVLGRLYKVSNWNNLKGELRRGIYILFRDDDSQKILVE